jgi:hypothetical protein
LATTTRWSRAGKGNATILRLRLSAHPTGFGHGPSARISLFIQAEGKPYGQGAAVVSVDATPTIAPPFALSLDNVVTGTEFWLAQLPETDHVRLGAFFVSEEDTRSARNHLWHIRGGVIAPTDGLTAALKRGRTGAF